MKSDTQPSPGWKTDIRDWRKLSKDSADFILEQAETILKETLDTAKGISLRAERIITLELPIAAALVAYALNNTHNFQKFLPLTAILCAAVILVSLGACIGNFEKYEIQVPGEAPKNILTSRFIENKFTPEEQYLNLVINQCENIQRRISKNDKINAIRARKNTTALYVLLAIIPCPLLAYYLSQ